MVRVDLKTRIKVDNKRSRFKSKKKYPENDECYYRQKRALGRDCSKLVKCKEKHSLTSNIARIGDEGSNIALTSSLAADHNDEWILDLGCTYHS